MHILSVAHSQNVEQFSTIQEVRNFFRKLYWKRYIMDDIFVSYVVLVNLVPNVSVLVCIAYGQRIPITVYCSMYVFENTYWAYVGCGPWLEWSITSSLNHEDLLMISLSEQMYSHENVREKKHFLGNNILP